MPRRVSRCKLSFAVAMLRPFFHPIVALGVLAMVTLAAAEPPAITPDEPRTQIRAEILKGTKPGASIQDVLAFIRTRFKPKPGTAPPKVRNHPAVGPTAARSEKKGVQSIRLVIGHYEPNPALFLLPMPVVERTTTAVQWAFDKDGKLIEVFVDKDSELGDQKGPDD